MAIPRVETFWLLFSLKFTARNIYGIGEAQQTCIRDVGSFDIHRDAMRDASLNLEFPGGLDFDRGTEGHLEVASVILGEALLKGLLEEG